jgi:hypothetical protein
MFQSPNCCHYLVGGLDGSFVVLVLQMTRGHVGVDFFQDIIYLVGGKKKKEEK